MKENKRVLWTNSTTCPEEAICVWIWHSHLWELCKCVFEWSQRYTKRRQAEHE